MTRRSAHPVFLLDANVLIALSSADHISHGRAHAWFERTAGHGYATCPITQGALVRFHARLHQAAGVALAKAVLARLAADPRHRFWPDDLAFSAVPDRGIRGHRQVTDAYLAALARAHGGKLATLDQALAAWCGDACELVAESSSP